MATITLPTTFVDGTVPTAAQFNGDFTAITNEVNGGLTDANISASAAITGTKIAAALTGKTISTSRINKRVGTATTAATHTINADSYDMYTVTAQGEAVTFGEPSGTHTPGQTLIIRIKDDGTARAITWNGVFRAGDTALPTTTVLSKTLYCGFIWNSTDSKWDLLALLDNF